MGNAYISKKKIIEATITADTYCRLLLFYELIGELLDVAPLLRKDEWPHRAWGEPVGNLSAWRRTLTKKLRSAHVGRAWVILSPIVRQYVAGREASNCRKLERVAKTARDAKLLFLYVAASVAVARLRGDEAVLAQMMRHLRDDDAPI